MTGVFLLFTADNFISYNQQLVELTIFKIRLVLIIYCFEYH